MNSEVVRVITPLPLTEEQKKIIKKHLSRLSPQDDFTLQEELDPSILGGVIIIWEEMLIDCSLKTQLQKIKERILKEVS
ncbi:MAG: F0F1 ATP synthase subunit delta [Candidatus Atribacteria bacterium]|nr:F0F1 ATP synthase subunit delta [Candidatus Atribacteria bacterium]